MKQFLLKLDIRSSLNENKFIFSEGIEADSMIELVSKLLVFVVRAEAQIKEEHERHHFTDDDIPF